MNLYHQHFCHLIIIYISNYRHFISYYKDEFKNRTQLSRSITGTAYMWLSKAQMKEGAKISLECNADSCSCSLSVIPKDKIEQNIKDKPYTYNVTEENKVMEFHIVGNIKESNPENCKISIWAKGNKNIDSNLSKESKSFKKRGYQAYLMKGEADITNCKLKVNGTIGDLIQVGVLFINEGNSIKTEINFPVLGFFKKGELDEIHFEKLDQKTWMFYMTKNLQLIQLLNQIIKNMVKNIFIHLKLRKKGLIIFIKYLL